MAAKKGSKPAPTEDVLTSPIVPLEYAWLTKPDTKYHKEGQYKANLVFSKSNSEHMEFLKRVKAICVAISEDEGVKMPLKAEGDTLVMTVKSKHPPKLFDRRKQAINDAVMAGPGTTARVVIKLAPYEGFGGGVTAYMNKVQIVDYVPWVGGGDEFEDEGVDEGGDGEDAFDTPAPSKQVNRAAKGAPKELAADEIPF